MDELIITVVHLSQAMFKELDATQKAIVVEAMVTQAKKTIGAEKTQEVIENVINQQLAREKAKESTLASKMDFGFDFNKYKDELHS